ncbi:MAG: glycosyltransferase family 4 protein [Verrucomicrobia bacterium]|nr:glycosyltransferase family 4 protein [Verrucomicrobiota bacterium]
MKLALSTLCENPRHRTGLTTLFHEFVAAGLKVAPDVAWVVFAGPDAPWTIVDARVIVVRDFPANDRRAARLWADHFSVAPAARELGAQALLTVGFVPLLTAGLPVAMHVFTVQHRRPGGGVGAWYRRVAVARGLRRAALVIANSRWTASQLGLPPTDSRLLVSHEGVQHDRFFPADGVGGRVPAPAFEGGGLPKEYLLWAGNFYAYKRVELALAAYAQLRAELRVRFPLVLAGGDWDGGRARAETVARALGLERDVRFLGWVDDAALPALYRGARAHVLATSEETFGRSVAEAMACGCPCVVQDLPVLREVTEGAALFCDFAESGPAGAALERICTDDALAARLRAAGVRRAAGFTFEKLARERIDALRAVVR